MRKLLLVLLLITSLNAEKRLLGGQKFDPNPTRVALIQIGLSSYCSGLLVGKRHILTAAHCLPSTSGVILDLYRIKIGDKLYEPEVAYRHAGFTPGGEVSVEEEKYDLAVILLSEDVIDRQPLPILNDLRLSKSDQFNFFGFGRTSESGTPWYDLRYTAKFNIENHLDGLFETNHTSSGASVCGGDSGGPGLIGTKYRVAVAVVGVAGTNLTKNGVCSLATEGYSLFVDLQSIYSQNFLSGIPGLEFISGKNMLVEDLVLQLRERLSSYKNMKKYNKNYKTLKSLISDALSINNQSRLTLLKTLNGTLKKLSKSQKSSDFKRLQKKALLAADNLIALGVN